MSQFRTRTSALLKDWKVAVFTSLAGCFLVYPIFILGEFGLVEGIIPLAITLAASFMIFSGFRDYLPQKALFLSAVVGFVVGFFLIVASLLSFLFSSSVVENFNLWARVNLAGQIMGVILTLGVALLVNFLEVRKSNSKYFLTNAVAIFFFYILIFVIAIVSTLLWIVVLHSVIK